MIYQNQYPIICTEDIAESANFYEDNFDFYTEVQMDGYILMRHMEDKERYIAFIDINSPILPQEAKKVTSGLILSFPVKNVNASYQQAYWEGLEILGEPSPSNCGKHFMVRDPNGNYIDIIQKQEIDEKYLVAA